MGVIQSTHLMLFIIVLLFVETSICARGGGGGRGSKGGGRRGRFGSRMPIAIIRNPASANYYDHKDVCKTVK